MEIKEQLENYLELTKETKEALESLARYKNIPQDFLEKLRLIWKNTDEIQKGLEYVENKYSKWL